MKNSYTNILLTNAQDHHEVNRIQPFISVSNIHHDSHMQKLSAKKRQAFLANHPHKIHLSINSKEYSQHKNAIAKLLMPYVNNGQLKEFKYIDETLLHKKIEAMKSIDIENKELYLASQYRFQMGDQFTLYLFDDVNQEDNRSVLINILNDIQQYFIQHNVAAGNTTHLALPITSQISYRLEYLNKRRVDAVNHSPSEIKAIQKEMINSPFYQFLSNSDLALENIIITAKQAITRYQARNRKMHLSFFANIFNSQAGLKRAVRLKNLLDQYQHQDPILGILVLYAMINYGPGKRLKQDLQEEYKNQYKREFNSEQIKVLLQTKFPEVSINKEAKKIAKTLKRRSAFERISQQLNRFLAQSSPQLSYRKEL